MNKSVLRKVLAVSLAAATVSSMTALSVSARDSFDGDDTVDNYFENHTIGIVGAMTDWGGSPDVPMTDTDGDGVYVGVYKDLAAGEYEFRVRADSAWADSWCMYEEDYDRTMNSQTNCKVTVDGTTDLIVMLDTNGNDEVLWPVSFFSTETMTASRYGLVGSMTSWSTDLPMYEVEEGKYVGIIKELVAGDYEFKVRADGAWDECYGVYEEDYDRTCNSQTDCKVSVPDGSDIVVTFDTTGDDDQIWPISYVVLLGSEVVAGEYTGKPVEEEDPSEIINPISASKYGIVGNMTGWGNSADFPMYETEKGVYVGKTNELVAGDYQFKVRADNEWYEQYGIYEADYDRTCNSQTNIEVTLEEKAVIYVKFDTTGDDDQIWPLSYAIVKNGSADYNWIYTGKPIEDEPAEPTDPVSASKYGIVGSMTGWGACPDFPMYETETGVYVGKTDVLSAGDYQFKVRADGSWSKAYGVYEADYDRTQNSQTNIYVTLYKNAAISVMLDTTGDDDQIWPVSYKVGDGNWIYTGKPIKDVYVGKTDILSAGTYNFKVRADGTWDESYGVYEAYYDRTYNSQTTIEVTLEEDTVIYVKFDTTGDDDQIWPVSYKIGDGDWVYTGKPVEDEPVSEDSEYYETQVSDYVFFDNSQTKWDEVYAYWWNVDYARTYDLENNDWGARKSNYPVEEGGTEVWEPVPSPGTKMTQIEGTDIWQIRVPFNATTIVFNSGKTDDQIEAKEIGYQTADLAFDAPANAGMIYTVDATPTTDDPTDRNANPTPGRGIYKTRYTYKSGGWLLYNGYYKSEIIGPEEPYQPYEPIGEISKSADIPKHSVGVVGSFNGWDSDIQLTDVDGDGVYEGVVEIDEVTPDMFVSWYVDAEPTGESYLQFKVRLDGEWSDSWGYYEPLHDRTWNSLSNVPVKEAVEGQPLRFTVYFDIKHPAPAALENPYSYAEEGDDDYNYLNVYYKLIETSSLLNISALSSTSVVLGNKITVNCSAVGGTGTYQYNVLYKQTSQTKWTTAQSYNANSTVTFKPAKATTYDVCVKVKDSDGTEVKKYFTVLVKADNISDFEYEVNDDNTVTITDYTGDGGDVVIPKTIDGKSVTSIGDSVFLGDGVFSGCTGLTSITIPDSVTSIGAWAFEGCTGLTIYGAKGSCAETYASENHIPFVEIIPKLENESTISANEILLGQTVTVNAKSNEDNCTYAVYYKKRAESKWTTK